MFSLLPPAPGQTAWNFQTLYAFGTASSFASGVLYRAPSGALYGVTQIGGKAHRGSVYRLSPPRSPGQPWTFRVLYDFATGDAGGSMPVAGIIGGATGALYGSTTAGPAANFGTIFKLTPPASGDGVWTETVLHTFGASDSAPCMAELVEDAAGNLYATTFTIPGIVFELSPPASGQSVWSFQTLFSFVGLSGQVSATGQFPRAPLLADGHGGFYGTTAQGGTASFGTIFHLSPQPGGLLPWTETLLHSFGSNTSDGVEPGFGVLTLNRGMLTGTDEGGPCASCSGGGTVFKVHP